MELRSGKKEFSRLIEKNQAIIHKISTFYTNQLSDKEDLFQEICYQLWRSYSSFNSKSKFTTWMYKVALNTAIGYIRKKKHDLKFEEIKRDFIAESKVDRETESQLLHKAISNLNHIDKAVIILWLEGNSYEEIAEVCGISKSNVSVKLVRIKEKLSKQLNP
jgi:RNA polymerase sigma-70 factor (ECF subfamily)